MARNSFRKGDRGNEHSRRQERMPSGAMELMMAILKAGHGASFFRIELAEKLLWLNPAWAKYFFTGKVPWGVMANPVALEDIKEGLTLKQKRILFNKSLEDVSHLRYCELNKITGMKRRLIKRGEKICSNTQTGMSYLNETPIENVARNLYNILNWNRGQLDTWHDHMERFGPGCTDAALLKRLRAHSNCAYDTTRLPNLANDMKIQADLD